MKINILNRGFIDKRDSAFPQAIQMPDGEILCSFCVGGGPEVTGGSELAKSKDLGKTWTPGGVILPMMDNPPAANHLKLSLANDKKTIFAYGGRMYFNVEQKFGQRPCEPVFCISTDQGHSWSKPNIIANPYNCPLEISYGIVPLKSGRLLAPVATLPAPERLGEKVIAFISDDAGQHWDKQSIVFESNDASEGYFEHKFVQFDTGVVMATAWTVTLGDIVDKENSFALSFDDGLTWSSPKSTGIMGQTMTPVSLGNNRLLVLYNRRYGKQGIVMALVTFTDNEWQVHHEELLYDAQKEKKRPGNLKNGVKEFDDFAFGFPTAIRLDDGSFLATYWRKESGTHCICWARLEIKWDI